MEWPQQACRQLHRLRLCSLPIMTRISVGTVVGVFQEANLEGMVETHPMSSFMSQRSAHVVRRVGTIRHCLIQENDAVHLRCLSVGVGEGGIAQQTLSLAFAETS